MHEDRAPNLPCFLDESDYFIEIGVLRVEEDLRLLLGPGEGQVADALVFEEVVNFSAAAVDDMGDLIE